MKKLKIIALAAIAVLTAGAAFAQSAPQGRFVVYNSDTHTAPAPAPAPVVSDGPVLVPIGPSGKPVAPPPTEMVAPDDARLASGAVSIAIQDGKASARRMPTNAQRRLQAARDWEKTGVADALVGQNGEIEYPYGYSRPTISCAPLHVCTIVFQPGEKIVSLSLGDTVRWLAQQTTAGKKPVVVVKPTQPGTSTDMVVTTDAGRVYYMHLVADARKYVPLVSFYDPAGMVQRQDASAAAAEAAKARHDAETVADFKAGFDPARLDFNYVCKGNDASLMPARVFASATHVYLKMPASMRAQDAPAVFAVRNGKTELINSHVKGDYYIVDGKPAALRLLVGVGQDQSAVTCEHK